MQPELHAAVRLSITPTTKESIALIPVTPSRICLLQLGQQSASKRSPKPSQALMWERLLSTGTAPGARAPGSCSTDGIRDLCSWQDIHY